MTARNRRAEAARQMILDSGDPELIRRLHLLEATAPTTGSGKNGPGMAGTAAAAGAGGLIGAVLGGAVLSVAMQSAFAAVADDIGLDTDGTELDLDGDEGGLLDDLGLGDFDGPDL